MIRILLLALLASCDDSTITVYSPGTRVEATTKGINSCVSVTVDPKPAPALLLVPMPMPYQVTAEKQP